ncbi:MAG: P-loop NTPase fold protein, partial [Solirubrobacteraceae bacterium]
MASPPPKPLFIAEEPVGANADVIFSGNPLGRQLTRIAHHIIQASRGTAPSPSITFLVSGSWGSGKSSALRYIRDAIQTAVPDEIVFASYPAPLY